MQKIKINEELTLLYKDLGQKLVNGVLTDNGVRPFDLIDFYMNFKKIPTLAIPYLYGSFLSRRETTMITSFLAKTNYCSFINVEDFLNSKVEINCQKDQNGFPIKGTGTILKREELQEILDFLVENDVPLYDAIINQAIRRFANNTLFATRQR